MRTSLTAIAMLSLLAAGPALADIERVVEERFAVTAGGRLELDADLGSVSVGTHAAEEVLVSVRLRADTNDESRAERLFEDLDLSFDHRGADVYIDADWQSNGFFRNDRLRVHYAIVVPESYDLDLDTRGGSIEVENLRGAATLNTSGGSLELSRITGNVKAHTSGGSITADGVTGDLDVSTSGGHLEFRAIQGDLRGRTSGGHIQAELTGQLEEGVDLRTSGGHITLRVSPELMADIDASTQGGRVSTDIPVMVRGTVGAASLQGQMNGGGPAVRIHTSGGHIRIERL